MKVETVEVGFHGADLFYNWDNEDEYDAFESMQLYANLLQEELERTFSEAEITVSYDTDASGVLPYNLQTRINGRGAASVDTKTFWLFEEVQDIEEKVYQEFKWVIRLDDET